MRKMLVLFAAIAAGSTFAGAQPTSPVRYRQNMVIQLPVSNLDAAVKFYTEVLGFSLSERRDDLRFAHIVTNIPGVEFGLSQVEKPAGTGGAVINISVVDAAEARTTLEAKGVVFVGPTVVIPGKVSLAAFRDPDGNRLTFAGPPPPTP